eukprot:TRINITY_DN2295_c0_g1_i1.p1 TRINITY_DN2295_c0_g1~~TRINITY_DN2295_c0_g1_i1.p1  ORF type:complete len:987 (+),score=185.05 TRINITY_DN2295_c0_g1_i1:62-2962(+)
MADQGDDINREDAVDVVDMDMEEHKTEGAGAADRGNEAEAASEAPADSEANVESRGGTEPSKQPDATTELEIDSLDDPRPKLAPGTAMFSSANGHATFNALPSLGGRVLMSLADGGLHHLLAAARANVGVKKGRYVFELQCIGGTRCQPTSEPSQNGRDSRTPPSVTSRPFFAVGFATARDSLFLGSASVSCGFDSDGNFLVAGEKTRVCQRLASNERQKVVSVLLNLDPSSAIANTLSFFSDGQRLCPPQPLPVDLKGCTLFPTVNFKNVTLRMNFGPELLSPLPFRCLALQDAAQEDVEVIDLATASKRRPVEVLFPISLPDEGTFEWLDGFLNENPSFTELSDRALLEWAKNSGLPRLSGYKARNSNDRPGMEMGIPEFDNATVKRSLATIAEDIGRDCVVMEVRNNLLMSERRKMLDHYKGPDLRRVAMVVMGEPPSAFKAAVRERTLADKKQRVASEARKKWEDDKETAAAKARRGTDSKNGSDEIDSTVDGANQQDDVEDSLEEVVKKAVDAVQLTEEEEKLWFYQSKVKDLSTRELGRQFANFSIPTEEEGFDEIRFVWQQRSECEDYLKQWIAEKKLTQRVEDLQPGDWFKRKWSEWQDFVDKCRWSHAERREPKRKRGTKRKSEDGNEEDRGQDSEAEDGSVDDKLETLDVFTVDDIFNIGNGEPLFAEFTYEDWTLVSLRAELFCLVHGFRYDMNDPERPSFHVSHVGFYYQKYFKKALEPKQFGFASMEDVLALVKDTVEQDPSSAMMESMLSDDTPFDNFFKLTEENRRERCIAADAGHPVAVLKFTRPSAVDHDRGNGGGGQPSHAKYNYSSSNNTGNRVRHGGNNGGGSYRGKGGTGPSGYSTRSAPPPPSSSRGSDRRDNDIRGRAGHGGYSDGHGSYAAPPPRSGYGKAPTPSSSYGGSHKRSYESSSQSRHGGHRGSGPPPYKQSRGSSYGAPLPSHRGSGGGGYGGRR